MSIFETLVKMCMGWSYWLQFFNANSVPYSRSDLDLRFLKVTQLKGGNLVWINHSPVGQSHQKLCAGKRTMKYNIDRIANRPLMSPEWGIGKLSRKQKKWPIVTIVTSIVTQERWPILGVWRSALAKYFSSSLCCLCWIKSISYWQHLRDLKQQVYWLVHTGCLL